jgi:hypothetical protein
MQSTGRRSVVDVALQGTGISTAAQVDRAKVLQRLRLGDVAFRHLTRAAAAAVLLILGGIIISLVWGSLPALRAFGISFLYEEVWNPVTEKFGAIAPIYGTVVTSLIAMLIAVPVGLFIALFLTELCPMWLRRPIGIAIELLAGIPSIIYGIWGLFVFAPFLQKHVQPFLIDTFANVPVLNSLFEGPPYGIGMLTAGLILAILRRVGVRAITPELVSAMLHAKLGELVEFRDALAMVDDLPTVQKGKATLGLASVFEIPSRKVNLVPSPYTHPLQYPAYYVPGVPARTFYDPAEFDWVRPLEEAYPVIKQELLDETSERIRLRRLCELLATAAETVERQREIAARAQTNGKVHPPA